MVTYTPPRAPLFVPADRPERFGKAALSGADAVILDLEDAVADEAKDRARAGLRCDFTDLPVIVRVNRIGSIWHKADLAALRCHPFAAVMLPKAESRAAIEALATALPDMPVLALIESAAGLIAARDIAASAAVTQLAFGSIDFCADLGIEHRHDLLLPARFELVLASRLAGTAAPLDGVTTQLDDLSLSFSDAAAARALGMGGKLCIHPRQVPPVRRAFLPSEAQIAWARRVLAAGDGAVAVDGEMVDEPVRLRARAILSDTGL